MSDADIVARLEVELARLVLEHFDHNDAWALGCALVELAQERSHPVAIDIHLGRQQVFHAALPGSSAENDLWIARKRAVVELTGEPSYLVGRRHAAAGTDFHELTGLPVRDYATHGGAVPILVRSVGPVGVAAVSGLAQADDHALVVEAIEQMFEVGE
ncbi:heme-degrading domain-containing protein [Isoptericola sp. b441]|uniref:Heme-degrading domain-containing protein n=1 Tax=Actinotalea lenta TaxID=3064654 RepID=A0ABT9DEC3_9CELL|nr:MULTISPECIES: heme-degrading domain-containing protein [unclassified Isoptericola]MDO8107743.1 heme-degrading domain-containing protein [Isoptericola sp. b441]MDO8120586.1 heme-degrading domain-containing protein [Isoptericola sp. b490]